MPSRTQVFSALAVRQSMVGGCLSGMPETEVTRTGWSIPQAPDPLMRFTADPLIALTPQTEPPRDGASGTGAVAAATSRAKPRGRGSGRSDTATASAETRGGAASASSCSGALPCRISAMVSEVTTSFTTASISAALAGRGSGRLATPIAGRGAGRRVGIGAGSAAAGAVVSDSATSRGWGRTSSRGSSACAEVATSPNSPTAMPRATLILRFPLNVRSRGHRCPAPRR